MSHAIASPPLRRFLWKEYRMVRGLWLAVLVLGLLSDWLLGVLLGPPADLPTMRLFAAFGWATLYAAGAAAVLFSVEHEEQTYDFLRGLPATWQPMFAGKLLIATASAVALGAVLAILGMVPGGFRPHSNIEAQNAASVLGMAIFEALAWGTLCSLIFRRPLAAALATLVVGSLAVSMVVSAMSSSSVPLNDPASYAAAIPLRLAVVVALFSLSTIIARRWLDTKATGPSTSIVGSPSFATIIRSRVDAMRSGAARGIERSQIRAMVVRLLWQSWRESWKFLMVPVVLAAVCLVAGLFGGRLYSVAGRQQVLIGFLTFGLRWCLSATPALLGALAFSADQRRGSVRFLSEHAAAPRVVWLTRQMVWLGSLIALMATTAIANALFLATAAEKHFEELLPNPESYGNASVFVRDVHQSVSTGRHGGWLIVVFSLCGALVAYAIGQFCSMLLRSEILSVFTSLVLAVVLLAWIAAVTAWGLSGWLFLLPLAIVFMSATWLRAPYWVAGRNSWHTWVWPAVVIAGALAIIGIMLPQVRLIQVRNVPSQFRDEVAAAATTPERTATIKKREAEATATADMYLKAADVLRAFSHEDFFKFWKPKGLLGPNSGGSNVARNEILRMIESQVPNDQKSSFRADEQKFLRQWKQKHNEALELASAASERPLCHFNFPLAFDETLRKNAANWGLLQPRGDYAAIDRLVFSLAYEPIDFGGQVGFDQLFTALRLNYHMRFEQPTAIALGQIRFERMILRRIANWAAQNERTNDERRAALEKLQLQFRRQGGVADAFAADRDVIRKVINNDEPPLVLASERSDNAAYLAFIANELPWERERALIALDLITGQNLQNASRLMNSLARSTGPGWGPNELRQWYRPVYQPAMWLMQQPQAATSYLVRLEYQLRVPVNELFLEYCHTVTVERATLLQIALAMYRADHQEYPPTLDALAPEYLETLPLDPYSMGNFEYLPQGLEKPVGGYGIATSDNIAPHTPLLWSIGPDDFQLQERLVPKRTGDDATTEIPEVVGTTSPDHSEQQAETIYSLERADWNNIYTNDNPREFLFSLPK